MKPRALSRGVIPVLCVHGFLGAPEDWAPLAAGLGPRIGVAAWPLPGHGSRAVDSFESAVRALGAALAAFPRPPHLVGYSMGGRLAWSAAAAGHPHASLTILSATPGLASAAQRAARARADDRLAEIGRAHV